MRMSATVFFRYRYDGICHPALVETVTAFRGDQAKGIREIGVAKDVSRLRSLAVRQISRLGIGMGAEEFYGLGTSPAAGNDLRHRKSLLSVVGGRGKELGERHRTKPLSQFVPARDATRHRGRVDAEMRH